MIKDQLRTDLKKILKDLGFSGDQLVLEPAKEEKFGDFSTNVALRLAKTDAGKAYQSALDIAKEVAGNINRLSRLGHLSYLSKTEAVVPGFVNFFVKKEVLAEEIKEILKQGENFGKNDSGKGKKARIEYVSANPTGPLHFGNARGGPIGDAIASVLEFCQWEVLREYLDNDRGNQILELGKTLAVRAGFILVPEEELTYKGEYTKELAEKMKAGIGEIANLPESEIITRAGELGAKLMFCEILKDCEDMGIKFDYVVHEGELQEKASPILTELEKMGVLKKHEGALWFAPKSEYLKDREAVVVKSDGSYTYFAADIVYHKEKFKSGYDLVVDVFGSNTFGHVPKLQALAEIFNFDLSRFKVILYQFVRIKRGQEVVRMSKRAGNFVTAREVLDEAGKDALRFFILMHDVNTHMDFDLELAREQSNKNPVYYVQYAHARMANILNKIKNQKSKIKNGLDFGAELLRTDYELRLIKHLAAFPELIEEIMKTLAAQKLTSYSLTLADLFHKFYEECPVLTAQTQELQEARLALVQASKIVLENALILMGISAPERM